MTNQTNRLGSLGKSLVDKLIVQGVWTTIVALVAAFLAFLISRKFHFSNLEIILSIILVVNIIATISYGIYRARNRKLPNLPVIDPDFHIVREERVHKWIDSDNYTHKRRYTLKALKNGLKQYTDKFQWTGTEYVISGGNSEYSVEEDKISKDVFNVYHFKFTTPKRKNDIVEVEASWKAKGPSKPFFSTQIEEPTDLLIMSVMLFPGCGVTQINCDTESYKGARIPIVTQPEKLNSDGEFTWQVKQPKLLYHYSINWKK